MNADAASVRSAKKVICIRERLERLALALIFQINMRFFALAFLVLVAFVRAAVVDLDDATYEAAIADTSSVYFV